MHRAFVLPDYTNSLLNIPSTIEHFFTGSSLHAPLKNTNVSQLNNAQHIIFFLLDGLGMNTFEAAARHLPFFSRYTHHGLVTRLTTVFPATTTAAITTLHTGMAPIEHGLYEWNLYWPKTKQIVVPLKGTSVVTNYLANGVGEENLPISSLYFGKTLYRRLSASGVRSVCFVPVAYVSSDYIKHMTDGAEIVGYNDIADLFKKLNAMVSVSREQLYVFVYWDYLDHASHVYGAASVESNTVLKDMSACLEKLFIKKMPDTVAAKTSIMFSADHGHVDIDPNSATDLSQITGLEQHFIRTNSGTPLLPTGSPRDMFLHVKPESVRRVKSKLQFILRNRSSVVSLDTKTRQKLFGLFTPHAEFNDRLGTIMILSNNNHACWYRYTSNTRLTHKSHHGSMLDNEMYIPFGCALASQLKSG